MSYEPGNTRHAVRKTTVHQAGRQRRREAGGMRGPRARSNPLTAEPRGGRLVVTAARGPSADERKFPDGDCDRVCAECSQTAHL